MKNIKPHWILATAAFVFFRGFFWFLLILSGHYAATAPANLLTSVIAAAISEVTARFFEHMSYNLYDLTLNQSETRPYIPCPLLPKEYAKDGPYYNSTGEPMDYNKYLLNYVERSFQDSF
jgi:hypothetical protein